MSNTACTIYRGIKIPDAAAIAFAGGDLEKGRSYFRTAIERAERDFQQIVGFLPQWAPVMLDIGCGPGILTLIVAKAVGAQRVIIVDGDGSLEKQTGFSNTKAWADVKLAQAVLVANLPAVNIVTLLADAFAIAEPLRADTDLVISTKSWGHHYPIETYLPQVQRAISDDGALIIDIRRDTDGLAQLIAAGFDGPEEIGETEKCKRYRLTFQIRF